MSDIVERLRLENRVAPEFSDEHLARLLGDAADEIERLHDRIAKLERVVEAAKKLDTHMMRFKEDVPLGLACLGVLLNAVLRDLNEPCKTCGGDGEEELSQDGCISVVPCPDCGGER